MNASDLGHAQIAILRLLTAHNRTSRSLRHHVGTSRASLNRSLHRLMERGLVERHAGQRQGRSGHPGHVYQLTRRGRYRAAQELPQEAPCGRSPMTVKAVRRG
jgi:predicted transcriptional regulator